MTENSYSDLNGNDKLSDDSYNNEETGKEVFRNINESNKENVKVLECRTCKDGQIKNTVSKSDSSRSSQNDDRSEHYVRLLKESQQSVSNRDLLIGMLQRQLKKIEDQYKKTLDQQQDIRLNYSNAIQELGHLKIVCNKLTEENRNLLQQNEENVARDRKEKEGLQEEVDKWKTEYDHLMKAIESMEKNTCAMKKILKDDSTVPRKQDSLNSASMEKLLEHYARIQEALTQQNEKLDVFLERFQIIGDGGCTIIKSLEGMKCVNEKLTKSLDSVVAERAEQPFEQVPPPVQVVPIFKERVPTEPQQEKPPEKPEKQKKNKKQKPQKLKQPIDNKDYDGSDEQNTVGQQIPAKSENLIQPKSKSKSKSKLQSSKAEDDNNYCGGHEEPNNVVPGKKAPQKEDKATMDESDCGSECGCYDYSVILNSPTSEKAVNTDCDCFDDYAIPEDYDEMRDHLVHAKQEIDRLNQLLAAQPAIQGETIVKCQNFPDFEDDYETVLKEKDALVEENNCLKAIITNLEEDVKKLTEDLDDANRDLEESRQARAELEKEIDEMLKRQDSSLKDIKEKYDNALAEIDTLREDNKALVEKIDLLNKSIKQHKDQTCLCKLELEKLNKKAKSLENSMNDIHGDVKQRDSIEFRELMSTKANLAELTEAYTNLQNDYDALIEDNKEVDLLKRKNSNLVRELDQRDVIIFDLREQVASLEKEVNSIREEMLVNNQAAAREMDVLMQACVDLENKLETTKEILEREGSLIDEEVNTSICCVESTASNNNEIDAVKNDLDEKIEEIHKLQQELEETRITHQEELQALKDHNDLLQIQLEQEQAEHQRDLEIAEEKLNDAAAQASPPVTDNHTSADDISEGEDSKTDIMIRLEESQEVNRNLKEELDEATRELKELRNSGKEFGIVRAENMKLKSKISFLQKKMCEMQDVEEKMAKLKNDKEEMKVKVQYLENQLNTARSNSSLEKVCPSKKSCSPTLSTITEEEATSTPPANLSKITSNKNTKNKSCFCDDKKYQVNTHVTILYDNKKFNKASNTDSVLTVDSQQSTDLHTLSGGGGGGNIVVSGNKFNKLQLRLANINQMEHQVANMILSVRQQNQRLNDCNVVRMRNEKDIESRLHHLKHKREMLMNSLNTFQKEIEVLGIAARDKVKNKSDSVRHCCHSKNK